MKRRMGTDPGGGTCTDNIGQRYNRYDMISALAAKVFRRSLRAIALYSIIIAVWDNLVHYLGRVVN